MPTIGVLNEESYYTLFFIICIDIYGQEQKITLAVNDLKSVGIDSTEAMVISNRIRSELIDIGALRVMEHTET
jgi:hypothetical protein